MIFYQGQRSYLYCRQPVGIEIAFAISTEFRGTVDFVTVITEFLYQ